MIFSNSKKGVGIQFNWIFVLIAGAIFFSFFFSIINNQISSSERESSRLSSANFEAWIKSSFSSQIADQSLDFSDEISFSCEDGISSWTFDGSIVREYDSLILFSPSDLAGNQLFSKSLFVNVPFRASKILLLTDDNSKYIFLDEDNYLDEIYDLMPNEANVFNLSKDDIVSVVEENFNRYVFVLVYNSQNRGLKNELFNIGLKNVFVLLVDNRGNSIPYGSVRIYSSQSDFEEVFFYDKEQLTGIIVSHDKNLIDCQSEKILFSIKTVSSLQLKRTEEYENKVSYSCQNKYGDFQNISSTDYHLKRLSSLNYEDLSLNTFNQISQSSNYLKQINERLLLNNCPVLY
jgi:hypothetical protein